MVWINFTTTRNQQNWWTTKPNVAKLSIFLIFFIDDKKETRNAFHDAMLWLILIAQFNLVILAPSRVRIWYKSSIFYEISKTSSSLNHFRNTLWFLSFFLQLTSIIFFLAKNQAWNHSFSFKKWHFQFQLNFCRQNSNCFPFKFLASKMKLIF